MIFLLISACNRDLSQSFGKFNMNFFPFVVNVSSSVYRTI